MKLSYFSYDFWECCCEAVNAVVYVGTFRWASAFLLPVWCRWYSGRRVLCQAGLRRGRRPARSPLRMICLARPGRYVCRWAAARLIFGVAVPRLISGRRVACPPARRPRCDLRSARRLEARPGPAGPAAASNRAVLVVSVLSVSLRHRPRSPRPHRHTPRTPPLPASLHERNIAPARSKWAKYSTFRRAGAKNISRHPTTPHAGAVFLSSQSHPYPTGEKKTRPARLHQRPDETKLAQHAQNTPKSAFFASRANFVSVSPRI